jgi:DNA-binding GntR family transcriptional regulator
MSAQIQESWPVPKRWLTVFIERLRQAIITGIIRPSERIRVADLERKFGVSHIPIREALRRLQSEGFVEISPRRTDNCRRRRFGYANMYDLRRIVEVEIGRRAVSRMTKSDIEAVRRALASFQVVANDPSSAEFWERHRDFGWAIIAPAANPTIKRVLEHLCSERYVRLFVSTFDTADVVMDLQSS